MKVKTSRTHTQDSVTRRQCECALCTGNVSAAHTQVTSKNDRASQTDKYQFADYNAVHKRACSV